VTEDFKNMFFASLVIECWGSCMRVNRLGPDVHHSTRSSADI